MESLAGICLDTTKISELAENDEEIGDEVDGVSSEADALKMKSKSKSKENRVRIQTDPPSIPVRDLFPDGVTEGEIQQYKDINLWKITSAEKRNLERFEKPMYNTVRHAAEVHPQEPSVIVAPDKERVVRVKRKRTDPPFESLWLELTRPVKRQEVNLTTLSLNYATESNPPTKLLYRRVETLSSGPDKSSLPEWLQEAKDWKGRSQRQEARQIRNTKDKRVQILLAAKEKHEASSRKARFERVWKSRSQETRGAKEEDPMQEIYHLYDAVRVDVEADDAAKAERRNRTKREARFTDGQLLCNYLPLLREFLPTVAAELDTEEDLSSTSEEYVYDIYRVDEDMDVSNLSDTNFPIFQVINDEDDWHETDDPDHDSEDSNGEDNPNNDYPEEEDETFADEESSDASSDVDPYRVDTEEYDTFLSDEERDIWRPRR